jgi:hypothetical protein
MRYSDPYAVSGHWYKGNLHTHTTTSDGKLSPAEVIAWYEQHGYHFVALTDHDTFCDPAPLQPTTRLALIPGFEFSRGAVPEAHMLCLGVRAAFKGDYQTVLTATRALGGMAILCHPNWVRDDLWSPDAMMGLRYHAGIEIYNHVITRLPGRALATDDWDAVLTRGHLIWGYANQDAHRLDDFGHAWNMVLAPSRKVERLLYSLANGHCYASTGLTFQHIGYDGSVIQVVLARHARIRFVGPGGAILSERTARAAAYEPTGEAYVRVEVENDERQWAWSQPFWRLSD